MAKADDASIIVIDKFIQATRDSGYKGTTSALAELVDNSLQAKAKNISINILAADRDDRYPIWMSILDDGCGMDRRTLRQALRFGGSSRFDDRAGLGRYGMGLPNSSLSQARRVEVFSWQDGGPVLYSYLDVDEIAEGRMVEVPNPATRAVSSLAARKHLNSGTQIVWSRCDRLSHSRISTLTRKLARGLGQVFRHYIWDGVIITINGEAVEPVDPLFLRNVPEKSTAAVFGETFKYEINVPGSAGPKPKTGVVTVTFAELPIHSLHSLSNEEKREKGISNGAGVSVVRADREVDFGWFFLNGKRRENYDDWWRCEVRFDPILDEAFGITHTKQQIRPQEHLSAILTSDMENMAKALNARVRQAHLRLKAGEAAKAAEQTAADRDHLLPPVPKPKADSSATAAVKALLKQVPDLKTEPVPDGQPMEYRIVEAKMQDTTFYSFAVTSGRFLLVLNPDHPFHRKVYRPLSELDTVEAKQARSHLDLLLLSAARADAAASKSADRKTVSESRARWSDILATYLNK